ncbi:similar to epoxide hydrolase [Plenodomus lingam JN3]|uniref:Similar to epoxide hydrolase n=1 Tax=Leptosphaeria maculans (strain JN3 / isolate v23.1.3 / race Av1-4-5-6-7-8) TaxID=985895 RepID=E5A1T1_LEPMJ|nr:similar to epoxide hydrolase [Plenodomus lingam JN3]CBX97648.1 similar to epoxide hydrolase [Plenodomus lingam JN3]
MSYSPPTTAKPFTLHISDQEYSEWHQLLQLSPLPPDTWAGRQEDRRFGPSRKWLSETKEYWLNQYDWRAQEAHINSFPNYKMQIENVDVHFVALFSQNKNAIPIIFMHGWPGSFIEFLPMCQVIREKYSAKDLPYHIIIPSLPGYTLSRVQSVEEEWTMADSARIMNQLMLALGFEKYLAQGGDVGSFQARLLSQEYEACVGCHLNMFTTPDQPDENTLSPLEKKALDRAATWRASGTAYAQEHGSRPNTIGAVLSSSPLALLAWIGEKFLEWTDEDPSLDTILTNISLYWYTSSFPRSIYPYRELFGPNRSGFKFHQKPTGFSFFPHELDPGIKSVLEKHANLVFYKQHERGGHFAALEKPREFFEDVEEYVGKAWKV